MKTHVPVAINTGLSGVPFWGTDIGGFVPTEEYTGELYARWFQFAAFCPLFRSHGRDWKLHLPWGWNTGEIGYPETPSYHPRPEDIRNPAIEPICRKYLELRYRLIPYIYSAAKETCETGLPMIRALWLHYPDDPLPQRAEMNTCSDGTCWLPRLSRRVQRAAPSICRAEPGTTSGQMKNMKGGGEIVRKVDLETMPLYVRAGAVLPTGPLKQYTSEVVDGPLTLTVFPGDSGNGFLYDDDGESFNFRNGEFMRIEMQWDDTARKLALRLASGMRMLRHAPIALEIKVGWFRSSQKSHVQRRSDVGCAMTGNPERPFSFVHFAV